MRAAYGQFCDEQSPWLQDYALFRALKARYQGVYFVYWPPELARREPAALASARGSWRTRSIRCALPSSCCSVRGALKEHAQAKGLRLIGDLPFFVSPDSSDVWANPELFLLDEQLRPRFVAGVPPDYFSARGSSGVTPFMTGRRYGGPAIAGASTGCAPLLAHVDAIRLDHFRGFAAAWHVPAGAPTAQVGQWVPGPGLTSSRGPARARRFAVHRRGPGVDHPGRRAPSATSSACPGQGSSSSPLTAIPAIPTYPTTTSPTRWCTPARTTTTRRAAGSSSCRIGSATTCGDMSRIQAQSGAMAAPALLDLAWSSVAALAMAPLQDLLNLGSEARMNVPGRAAGNWSWRCTEEMLSDSAFEWLRTLTESSHR